MLFLFGPFAGAMTLAYALGAAAEAKQPATPSGKTSPVAQASPSPSSVDESVLAALEKSNYHFTTEVKSAYLAFAKAEAIRTLAKAGQSLPADFMAWVDSDSAVAATIYGIQRGCPAQALAALRSLELDLGAEEVLQKHTQLALAFAVVDAPFVDMATMGCRERGISLAPRAKKFELQIPPCPLVKVNTHPVDRPLDLNDHIINFFEGRTFTEDKPVTQKVDGKKVHTTEKWTHPLEACDVIAHAALQKEFNAYMREHGQSVSLDCGDGVLTRYSDRKPATHQKEITAAFNMFLDAYKAKGLFPKAPDPEPTSSETVAYLLRNDALRFPSGDAHIWPRFPLTAPWPVMVDLANDRLPLREREFIWKRFRDDNKVNNYGDYSGPIAQSVFLQVRRLCPFDFGYGTFPMMLKDGGVCGTMSNIARRSDIALGIPACQAAQPMHSCLVA